MEFVRVLQHYLSDFGKQTIDEVMITKSYRIQLFLQGIESPRKKLIKLKAIATAEEIKKEDAGLVRLAILFWESCVIDKGKRINPDSYFGHIHSEYEMTVTIDAIMPISNGSFVVKFINGNDLFVWFSNYDPLKHWQVQVNSSISIRFYLADHKFFRNEMQNIITSVTKIGELNG